MKKKFWKELFGNIISLGSIDVLGMIIPILLMPIISRAMGIELYGKYLLFMTVLAFGHTIIDYGVQYSGVRSASKLLNNNIKLKNTYEEYQGLRFILALFFFVLSSIYFCVLGESIYVYIFLAAYILGYLITSSWFFRAIGKAKLLLYSSIFSKILHLTTVILFVNNESDYLLLLASSTIPFFISSLFLFGKLRRNIKISFYSLSGLKEKFKSGVDIFIGLLAPNLYNSIPIIILGSITNKVEFAQFMISYKLCSAIYTFLNVISKSIFPIVARVKTSKLKIVLTINLVATLPIIFIVYFYGYDLTLFILDIQLEEKIYLELISISLIFVALSNAFSTAFFLPNNLDKVYRNISMYTSVISSIICFVLIYNYGLLGCALGLLIARVILFTSYYFTFKRAVA